MKLEIGIVVLALALAGCGGPKGGGRPTATVEYAPTGEGKLSGSLNVLAFKGGYGIDFYQEAGSEFQAKNPGLIVKVDGSPDVADQVRTAMLAGDPPDLMFPSWKYDFWMAVEEGQILDLDKALDSPAYGGMGTWRDTFEPSLLKLAQENGKQYMLPYYFSIFGWWYDPGVFAKHGWKPPKTYAELEALCEQIKAAGIAPITFQGKYPSYMLQGMLFPWVQDLGGIQALDDIQNLVPGAWKKPAVVEAARMIKELEDRGDFQKGAVGLSHTEAQTEFLNGHAAMIPCGTWLDSEMKKVMPPGARMQFFTAPLPAKMIGDPTALDIEIEPWMVPVGAKNAAAAVAFYKYMTSLPEARRFVQEKATLMSIKGSNDVELPETLTVAAKCFRASKTVYSLMAFQWYQAMGTDIGGALTSMLNGELTPEQFCDRAESIAAQTRDDSSIEKFKVPSAAAGKQG
ncbi:MAG TPA: extracellular solute-binding protein [Fimbriimonadaceae bacterium]|nr:extracellular solute-binding protein [Fimbriimonadaceae bacterium]